MNGGLVTGRCPASGVTLLRGPGCRRSQRGGLIMKKRPNSIVEIRGDVCDGESPAGARSGRRRPTHCWRRRKRTRRRSPPDPCGPGLAMLACEARRYRIAVKTRISGSASPNQHIYLGARSPTSTTPANGVIDELKIYGQVIPPF